jgi:hypothetical protein
MFHSFFDVNPSSLVPLLQSCSLAYPLPLRISNTTFPPALTPSLLLNSKAALVSHQETRLAVSIAGAGTGIDSIGVAVAVSRERERGRGRGRAPKEADIESWYID